MFIRLIHKISEILAMLSALMVAVAMFTISIDVIYRMLSGRSIPGVVEVNEAMMAAIVYLGIAVAQKRREHVRVELFISRLNPKARRGANIFANAATLAILAGVAIATLREGVQSLMIREFRFGLLSVPVWPAKLAIPVGVTALILEVIVTLCEKPVEEHR